MPRFIPETMSRLRVAALGLSLLAAGCATQQGTAALECGGGGAAGAVLLCKLAGGSDQKCAALAVGVGVAGAAICYSYASNIQKHRNELAGHENDLDARIKYLHGVNDDTQELNRQLAAKINVVTQSTDQTADAIAKGTATQDQITQKRKELDNEVKAAQAQVDTAARELKSAKEFQAKQPPGSTAALDAEIARLQGLLNEAQRDTNALAAQRQRI
jgi:archaellum component FlaC